MKPELTNVREDGCETYRTRALDCSCKMAVCRCLIDYIVFYAQGNSGEWIVERTSDKQEMARGSLKEMMFLVDGPNPPFPGRRAHIAEDMTRYKPAIFGVSYTYGKEET